MTERGPPDDIAPYRNGQGRGGGVGVSSEKVLVNTSTKTFIYLFVIHSTCTYEYIRVHKQIVQYGRLSDNRQYTYTSSETIVQTMMGQHLVLLMYHFPISCNRMTWFL